MAPTLAKVAPIAGQSSSFFDGVAGAPTFVTAGLRSGGGDCAFQCVASAAAVNLQQNPPASTRHICESFYVRITANCTVTATLYQATNASGNPVIQVTAANLLRASIGSGANVNSNVTMTLNQWYLITLEIDTSGATATMAWWIDRVPQPTASVAQAAADCTAAKAGVANSGTVTAQIMDWCTSYTANDGAQMPAYITKLYVPTGIGTHSVGSGAFKKTGSVTVDGTDTNSYLEIDEMPPSNTDWVGQTAIDSTHYLEYTLADSAETNDVAMVCYIVGFQGSAAAAYTFEVRPYDGTTEGTDITTGLTKSATTARFGFQHKATNPTGQAWTKTRFNAMKLRFGFSSDVTPNPEINSMAAVAATPQSFAYAPSASLLTAGSSVTATKKPGPLALAAQGSSAVRAVRPGPLGAIGQGNGLTCVLRPGKLGAAGAGTSLAYILALTVGKALAGGSSLVRSVRPALTMATAQGSALADSVSRVVGTGVQAIGVGSAVRIALQANRVRSTQKATALVALLRPAPVFSTGQGSAGASSASRHAGASGSTGQAAAVNRTLLVGRLRKNNFDTTMVAHVQPRPVFRASQGNAMAASSKRITNTLAQVAAGTSFVYHLALRVLRYLPGPFIPSETTYPSETLFPSDGTVVTVRASIQPKPAAQRAQAGTSVTASAQAGHPAFVAVGSAVRAARSALVVRIAQVASIVRAVTHPRRPGPAVFESRDHADADFTSSDTELNTFDTDIESAEFTSTVTPIDKV